MSAFPACPTCKADFTYQDGVLYVCPSCGHEWPQQDEALSDSVQFRDANGAILQDGDSVTLIKDLKVKGSSMVIKVGTKVTGIRLVEGDHDIDCKVNGQKMMLKSCFVKKA